MGEADGRDGKDANALEDYVGGRPPRERLAEPAPPAGGAAPARRWVDAPALDDPRWRRALLALYVGAVLVVVARNGVLSHTNDFAIFRSSFGHLWAGRDLYARYPAEYDDRFKYSPTFALVMAPFAVGPFALGLLLWNGLNAAALWYAVSRLLPRRRSTAALALIFFEVLRAMQRSQSNSLVAALMVLAFVAYERDRPLHAGLAVALGTCVKLFPAAAATFALPHPRRVRAAALGALALAALVAAPLLVVSPHGLARQYASWRAIEAADALAGQFGGDRGGGGLYGGVMQQFRIWLGVRWPNWPVQLAGTALLLLPLALRRGAWGDAAFRARYLCALLVFAVIFNHQAESPSFVIAVTGIAVWYVSAPPSRARTIVMALTIVVVSLSSTDITPHWLQRAVFVRYRLKTVPCMIAWVMMEAELLRWGAGRAAGRGMRGSDFA